MKVVAAAIVAAGALVAAVMAANGRMKVLPVGSYDHMVVDQWTGTVTFCARSSQFEGSDVVHMSAICAPVVGRNTKAPRSTQ